MLILMTLLVTGTSCKDLGERLSREVNRTVRDNARAVEEGVLRDSEKVQREVEEKLGRARDRGQQALDELEREASKVLRGEDVKEMAPGPEGVEQHPAALPESPDP
jgi:hypothetical protein